MNAAALVTKLLEDDPDVVRPKDYLRQIPKRVPERWCFSEADLQHPERCKAHDELIAGVNEGDFPDNITEVDVIVYRNGQVTDRFADTGETGVPKNLQELADNEEELFNPRGHTDMECFCTYWRDVWTDETGEFLGWNKEG